MKQSQINQLHEMIINFIVKNELSDAQVISYLMATLTGTMAMHGYSESFFSETCDKMKKEYKEKLKDLK